MPQHRYYRKLKAKTKPVTKKILSKHFYTPGKWTPEQAAAALHYYIKQKIPYETRGRVRRRPLRGPLDTFEKGGNCEEKTILLCNLLHNVKGIHTRMLTIESPNPNSGHLLAEVGFETLRSDISQDLDYYYEYLQEEHSYTTSFRDYYYRTNTRDQILWYVADPEMSSYIGDVSSLENQGYIRVNGDSWQYHHIHYTQTPPRNI